MLDIQIDTSKSRPWKGIVIHHSASPDGVTRDWGSIIKYHTSYRVDFNIVSKEEFDRRVKARNGTTFQTPWQAVGYHAGIEWINDKVTYQQGRSLSMIGAHAGVKDASNRFNVEYLGLCAVGNFDLKPPKPEMWDFSLRLTRSFMKAFQIPKTHIIGHREVFDRLGVPRQKTCPGKYWDMDLFRSEL